MSGNNKQGSDDWDSYRALVVDNFKRINKRLDEIETKFDELKDNSDQNAGSQISIHKR